MVYLSVVFHPRLGGTLRHLIPFLFLFACGTDPVLPSEVAAPAPVLVAPTEVIQTDVDSVEPETEEVKVCPSAGVDPTFLKRTLEALVDHSNRRKFILWQNNYGNDDNSPDSVRVVYVYKGVRYTLWHNPSSTSTIEVYGKIIPVQHDGHIGVWERPNGTKSDDVLDTYSDTNFRGCVDFGNGNEARNGSDQRSMRWNNQSMGEDLNTQYHSHWQARYSLAIEGLAATLGVK